MNKHTRPYEVPYPRFGILNPYGQIWTHNTFDSEADAKGYLERFWEKTPDNLPGFKVIKVVVTITAAPEVQ